MNPLPASKLDPKNPFHNFMVKLPEEVLFAAHIPDRWGYYNKLYDIFEFLSAKDRDERKQIGMGGGYEEFPYIQYNPKDFYKFVKPLMKGVKSFIDVGCGAGDKLAIVKHYWPKVKVHGIEHDPAMAIWAGLYGDKVICGDALDLDYSPYDLIYLYWPIADKDLMNKLMKRIVDTKQPKVKVLLLGFGYNHKDIISPRY